MNKYPVYSCPFCGSSQLMVCDLDYESGHSVLCLDCGCSGPHGITKEEALLYWIDRYDLENMIPNLPTEVPS